MSGAAGRHVFTAPPGVPLADALALGVSAECKDKLALGQITILLPHRRAVRAVTEAFLRRSNGQPVLLPALRPIGDVDEDDAALLGDEAAASADDAELPPPISGTRRIMLLAQLILARRDIAQSADQAMRLAEALARLLDQAHTERCSFDKLRDLAPAQFARHWEQTVQFLQIVTDAWPQVLQEEGALDPAARRDMALGMLARRWRARPPQSRILIAGSTGSVPATAELMKVVAGLPRGAVILPGFDRAAVAADEQAILADDTHPQHAMARLVRALELTPETVEDWPPGASTPNPARAALLSAAMRPAEATHSWRSLPKFAESAIESVWRLDCPSPREEAAAIALMLREVLETQGKTAALVTPDRTLARRVAAEMKRWGVEVDDSAGLRLCETPPGIFMRLAARMIAEHAAPVPLLACFKHPLACGGMQRDEFRARARRLEMTALRGPRPAPGLRGIAAALKHVDKPERDLIEWIAAIETRARELTSLMAAPRARLADLLAAHWELARFLATGPDGVCGLQRGDAGEALMLALDEANGAVERFPPVAGAEYPQVFDQLLSGKVVRPRRGQHPRLAIWGLLEARLQQADRLILAGLNEGTWPPGPVDDPWLSRPMRKEFGLPLPERRIGLSAHDFAQGFLAPEVILTRATRVEGTPTVPSRWLLRLDAVLRARDSRRSLQEGSWLHWQERLDDPGEIRPVAPPMPRPPVAARPRRLSVTQIETWMRDPYAIYARHILRLPKLDELDAEPGAADRGILIHRALAKFLNHFPGPLADDALGNLLEIGRREFAPLAARPGVWAFWWPRFQRAAAWFVEHERKRRPDLAECFAELGGQLAIAAAGGPFLLTAKADRVDKLRSGGIAIIDYKSGQLPDAKDIELGFAAQLTLEAAIAAAGGFKGVGAGTVEALEHWAVGGGAEPGESKPVAGDPMERAQAALAGLRRLIDEYDNPATPYASQPRAAYAPKFSDYRHLARVQEWSVIEGDA